MYLHEQIVLMLLGHVFNYSSWCISIYDPVSCCARDQEVFVYELCVHPLWLLLVRILLSNDRLQCVVIMWLFFSLLYNSY